MTEGLEGGKVSNGSNIRRGREDVFDLIESLKYMKA